MNASGPACLITGASGGLGRAIALRLAPSFPLILHGRDDARLAETLAAVPGARAWPLDLQRPDLIEPSLLSLLAGLPAGISSLVYCAGISRTLPLRSVDPAVAAEVMNINLLSALEIIRLLARKTVNGKNLRQVVLLSSINARNGGVGQSIYSATKAAMGGLARALALEMAPHCRVNVILPGTIRTPMSEAIFAQPALEQQERAKHPLGFGRPEDVAGAVAFLLSDQAAWITGQELVVDGGRTLI